MSSFIVGNETIDAIIEGARRAQIGAIPLEIHLCSDGEVDAYRLSGVDRGLELCARNREELGRFLRAYNVVAANAHRKGEPLSGAEYGAGERREYTDGEIFGACTCYEYQVEDAEGFDRGGTKSFLGAIRFQCAVRAFKRLGETVPYGIGGNDMTRGF